MQIQEGMTFGRLTVISRSDEYYVSPKGYKERKWRCLCNCGNIVNLLRISLVSGSTLSCGCYYKECVENSKKRNKYEFYKDYVVGYATNSNEKFYIDIQDYDKIKNYCWFTNINGATKRISTKLPKCDKTIKMHTFLGFKGYDHINRNELDNRRVNLRKCTHQENSTNVGLKKNNKSGIIGVFLCKTTNKWIAQIKKDYKNIHLGSFINKDDAIKARLEAEAKYFGEYAPQQNLFEKYGIIKTKIDYSEENSK